MSRIMRRHLSASYTLGLLVLVSVIAAVSASAPRLIPARALTKPSLVETSATAEEPVCVKNVPNVRGVLRATCCSGLRCGFTNGVCCQGNSHCCPTGTVCVEGDPGTPPGCLHVMDAITREMTRARQQSAQLRQGFVASREQPVGTVPLAPAANNRDPAVIPFPFATGIPCDDTPAASASNNRAAATTNGQSNNCRRGSAVSNAALQAQQALQQQQIASAQPTSRIVYEDALVPHQQNAFSQFRIEKTSEHHIAVRQGQPFNQKIITKRIAMESKDGYRLPPVPPARPVSQIAGQPRLTQGGNPAALLPTSLVSAAGSGAPAAASSLAAGSTFQAGPNDMPGVIYNLPDPNNPGQQVPYNVVIKPEGA